MKCVDLSEIRHMSVEFYDLEIFPESWTKRNSFTLYKDTPRPSSALFLICTDIRASYYPEGGAPVTAGKGALVWIPSGVRYQVEVDSETENRIATYTLNFRLLDRSGEEIHLSDTITVLAHEQNKFFETHVKTLTSEMAQQRRNMLKINSELYALLDAAADFCAERREPYYPIRVGAEALKNEWNKNRRIEDYADMCGISTTYFYRCFREWCGKSPVAYRNMIRLSNAETMLRHTNMKINEISETIGFEDPFYFCRLFSKRFGVSPKNYRKNAL